MMKKSNIFFDSGQNNGHNPKKRLKIAPVHNLATFSISRKSVDPARKFEISLLDFFPPTGNLTANETKVLIVLRAMVIGKSNLAAIDQEQIASITSICQPNIARAIAGLHKKGIIKQIWMEEGTQLYRNVYSLWTPPNQLEKDAKKMLAQKKAAKKLEQQAKNLETKSVINTEKLRKKAQEQQEKICPFCNGSGISEVYFPSENKNRLRWCYCSLGIYQSRLSNCNWQEVIPEHIASKYLSTIEK